MVLYSRYQTRLSDAGSGLTGGVRVLGVGCGRKTCTECFNWSRREDSLEKEDGDGSENSIRWYEEGVSPQAVKSSPNIRNSNALSI